ncbi:hypothetical protein BE20_03535 [Sorangium cellulosum]|nr:hypothetical protein BE20_03535 [Sorangium cellulosum]
MRKSDKSFGQGAALLAASFTFAGLEDLAAKVRPSARCPSRSPPRSSLLPRSKAADAGRA